MNCPTGFQWALDTCGDRYGIIVNCPTGFQWALDTGGDR